MPNTFSVTIPFGGGVHSRASAEDINPQECADGQNFDLDPQNRSYRNRKPFDLIGTVPNAAEIRGFVNLLKTDGTVSLLVQAGSIVYEWDGATTFTNVGTVSSTAKLRGRLEHNWQLDNKVIITDMNLAQPVMEWDGTTLQNITFTKNDGSTAWTGDFKAKYCVISNERVMFANINDNSVALPHLIVGSQSGSYTIISNNQRPSSALSTADPFYLIQPDYHYINGMIEAFGVLTTSSKKGSMFNLTGTDATDFAFTELYPRSGASGDEAVAFIGNDVAYGREGRIESLISTNKYGDVDADDLSIGIFDQIEDYDNWTLIYNSRLQRFYCLPENKTEIWVYHKPLALTQLSPWSKWKTNHDVAFQPSAIMNMIDPADGLEYVFFGDANGNFYRLEGSGSNGDGGNYNIKTQKLSSLIDVPITSQSYDLRGEVKYKSNTAITLMLEFFYQGRKIITTSQSVTIPATSNRAYYSDGYYYNNGTGYGSFSGLFSRIPFRVPAKGNSFQVRATVESTNDFEISSLILKFEASSTL